MTSAVPPLALCTTVYPGVEPYLRDWYASVLQQTDRNYRLWIALDGLTVAQAAAAMGGKPDAVWVQADPGETPAAIRQRVLAPLIERHAAVVLVDSDDVLHPGRVAAARAALEQSALVACALRLVDQKGQDLGTTFRLPDGLMPETVLPRYNVFGLSNTAWRCELLARCLPVPSAVELVDWFLASRAWLLGAPLAFDAQVGMDYRQHPTNMARVRAPFSRQQVERDTARVQAHFHHLRSAPLAGALAERWRQVETVAADVERFAAVVLADEVRFAQYLTALNALNPAPLWWSAVAHPQLKQLWFSEDTKECL